VNSPSEHDEVVQAREGRSQSGCVSVSEKIIPNGLSPDGYQLKNRKNRTCPRKECTAYRVSDGLHSWQYRNKRLATHATHKTPQSRADRIHAAAYTLRFIRHSPNTRAPRPPRGAYLSLSPAAGILQALLGLVASASLFERRAHPCPASLENLSGDAISSTHVNSPRWGKPGGAVFACGASCWFANHPST